MRVQEQAGSLREPAIDMVDQLPGAATFEPLDDVGQQGHVAVAEGVLEDVGRTHVALSGQALGLYEFRGHLGHRRLVYRCNPQTWVRPCQGNRIGAGRTPEINKVLTTVKDCLSR